MSDTWQSGLQSPTQENINLKGWDSPPSATSGDVTFAVPTVTPSRPRRTAKKVESAVYAHIQAMRALGKTRIDTAQIARALGLTLAEVEQSIAKLRKKGVKTA